MKHTVFFILALLFFSCESSLKKIVLNDKDTYSILNKQEFMVVKTPYAYLKSEPSLNSTTLNLLRKQTVLRILGVKLVKRDDQRKPDQWFYVENTNPPHEQGWMLEWESLIAPNIYNAQYIKNTLIY